MEKFMKDSDQVMQNQDEEFKHELMEVNMKDSEKMIKPVAWEGQSMPIMIFMKENDQMTKHMDLDNIFVQMELNIQVNGKMTSKVAKVLKFELMVLNMKENIKMEKRMEKESFNSLMDLLTKGLLKIMILTDMEYILEQMEKFMKGNEVKIKCMVMGKLLEKMVGCMQVNMLTTKSKVKFKFRLWNFYMTKWKKI